MTKTHGLTIKEENVIKKYIYAAIIAATSIISGCSDELVVRNGLDGNGPERTITFKAGMEIDEQTRTTYEEIGEIFMKCRWEVGDELTVKPTEEAISETSELTGKEWTFKAVSVDEKGTATFSCTTSDNYTGKCEVKMEIKQQNLTNLPNNDINSTSEHSYKKNNIIIQHGNGSTDHLKYTDKIQCTKEIDFSGINGTNEDKIIFTRSNAIIKLILSDFDYNIWPGTSITLDISGKKIEENGEISNDRANTDLSKTSVYIGTIGDWYERQEWMYNQDQAGGIYYNEYSNIGSEKKLKNKENDKKKTKYVKIIAKDSAKPICLANNDETNTRYTKNPLEKISTELIAYIAIEPTELETGDVITVRMVDGRSRDEYHWHTKLKANKYRFEKGKIYTLDFRNRKHDLFICISNSANLKFLDRYMGARDKYESGNFYKLLDQHPYTVEELTKDSTKIYSIAKEFQGKQNPRELYDWIASDNRFEGLAYGYQIKRPNKEWLQAEAIFNHATVPTNDDACYLLYSAMNTGLFDKLTKQEDIPILDSLNINGKIHYQITNVNTRHSINLPTTGYYKNGKNMNPECVCMKTGTVTFFNDKTITSRIAILGWHDNGNGLKLKATVLTDSLNMATPIRPIINLNTYNTGLMVNIPFIGENKSR